MGFERRSNRRQFLKGTAALDALQDLQSQAGDLPPTASSTPNTWRQSERPDYLMRVGRRAMACEFQVFVKPSQQAGAVEAATEALDLIDTLEDQMSAYRPQSELMRLNRVASQQAVAVEPRLFDLLCLCSEWNMATGGAFDITSGPLVKLWGFYTRQGRFPTQEEVEATRQFIGARLLEFNRAETTIQFARTGVELNLGSVGKGYALDRCAEILDAAGVSDYLFHGGQSSILARGRRGVPEVESGWSVAVRHPLRPERRLAQLRVSDRGLGTSGSGQQFFYHQGHRYGHVLDPRTGLPAEGVLSATVLADSAARADALATAFFVMGFAAAQTFCENHSDVSALFVLPGSRQGTVAIETIGAIDELTLLDE